MVTVVESGVGDMSSNTGLFWSVNFRTNIHRENEFISSRPGSGWNDMAD